MQEILAQPKVELQRLLRIVAQLQVDVVPGTGRPAPKRLGPVRIREYIKTVPPALDDGQRSVCTDPEDQVRKLAEAAARRLLEFALVEL